MKLTQNTDSKVFDRLRLLTRVGIVFLLLIAVVALPSLPALSDDKPRSPKARALDDINNGAVADLRPIITKEERRALKAKKTVIRRSKHKPLRSDKEPRGKV